MKNNKNITESKKKIAGDINEDKNDRQKAAEAEKYCSLYAYSRDAIMTVEPPNLKFISGNPAAIAMFKVKDEKEFTSLDPADLSPEKQPDGRLSSEKAKEMVRKALETGSNFFGWVYKRYKGENFPATVLLSRVNLDGKKNLQATVKDITEEKKIIDKLAESEERFKNFFYNSSLGMAIVSPQGKWLQVNKAVCKIFGYSEQEMLNLSFEDVTYPDDTERDLAAMKKILVGEMKSYQTEKRYINKKGEVFWASLHASLVRDKNKQPLYFVSEIEDISKRKKIEAELQEKMIDLEKINKMMVGRELKMMELKKQVEELSKNKKI